MQIISGIFKSLQRELLELDLLHGDLQSNSKLQEAHRSDIGI